MSKKNITIILSVFGVICLVGTQIILKTFFNIIINELIEKFITIVGVICIIVSSFLSQKDKIL